MCLVCFELFMTSLVSCGLGSDDCMCLSCFEFLIASLSVSGSFEVMSVWTLHVFGLL